MQWHQYKVLRGPNLMSANHKPRNQSTAHVISSSPEYCQLPRNSGTHGITAVAGNSVFSGQATFSRLANGRLLRRWKTFAAVIRASYFSFRNLVISISVGNRNCTFGPLLWKLWVTEFWMHPYSQTNGSDTGKKKKRKNEADFPIRASVKLPGVAIYR